MRLPAGRTGAADWAGTGRVYAGRNGADRVRWLPLHLEGARPGVRLPLMPIAWTIVLAFQGRRWQRSRTGPGFPGCRRWNPTMVRMNSTRKTSYASVVALLLAVSPLVLALPATAGPCKPAGLLPVKICPASPTPGPPSASPAPGVTPPGGSAPPSDPAPPRPSQSPSQSQAPGQDAAPPTPGPAPSVSQGAPTPPATGAVPVPATVGTSAPQSPDAVPGPEPATAIPSAAAAGRVGPGPDGQGSLAGGFLLALSGLLIGLSAAIGLRRPAGP